MSITDGAEVTMKAAVRFIWAVLSSGWRKILLVSSVGSFLVLVACGASLERSPRPFPNDPAAFTGRITLVVSEPGTKSFVNFTYEYDLDVGIARLKDIHESPHRAGIPVDRFATGYVGCYGSPRLESPNGKFTARCEGPRPGVRRDHQQDFLVVEDKTGKEVFKQGAWYTFQIIGYAWSPDSRSIAIVESANGWMVSHPLDSLAGLTGDPTPVRTFYVRPYSVNGSAALGAIPAVPEGSYNGVGIIVSWR
jgi:hypothetical protein